MGYRGKLVEQQRARELRAEAWTLEEIAAELGVAKSSVSLWVRDVEFEPKPREWSSAMARRRGASVLQQRKTAEIEELRRDGLARIASLTEKEFLVAGTMLYAAEGSKTPGIVNLPNTDPRMVVFFCTWLRTFFDIDEARLRVRLYLHEGLDLEA